MKHTIIIIILLCLFMAGVCEIAQSIKARVEAEITEALQLDRAEGAQE